MFGIFGASLDLCCRWLGVKVLSFAVRRTIAYLLRKIFLVHLAVFRLQPSNLVCLIPPNIMAEESLNLSLDDIIKRNADNNKRNRSEGGAARRGGRGGRGGRAGRSGDRTSSFQPKVQTRVVKTIRGGGAGRVPSRGRNVCFSRQKGSSCR